MTIPDPVTSGPSLPAGAPPANPSAGGALVTIAEAALAMAVFAGILLALSDSPAYPLAFGIAGLSLLYVLLSSDRGTVALKNLIDWSRSHATASGG